MNTEMKNAIEAADAKAQYDACAKRLLGQKSILAHILVRTVEEFQDMDPRDVEQYIEGEPYISSVPVEPGLTNRIENRAGQRVVGFNTENAEIGEGLVRFDIVCYVRMRDGLSQVILNIEAQKEEPFEYDILNRAVFYASRLISSQKERDFKNTNYNDIKRVYSIWVCMNMKTNCLNYFHLTEEQLLGEYQWKGKRDLLNIMMIGLAENIPERSEEYELHRMLGALLSPTLEVEERLDILETEYRIPIENGIREDVRTMCNLSEGIEEKGIAKGMEQGLAQGRKEGREEGREQGQEAAEKKIILNMSRQGFTSEQIAAATEKTISDIEDLLKREKSHIEK